ncbi:MAG TPA: TonB-dependent receptor, partial [Bryobacteraceae bacterium]|nr:TonB-dependent receptor [Bryobacteraceae bacterium]
MLCNFRFARLVAGLVIMIVAPMAAQEYRGMITGIVMDSSQAAIPDVDVTITHASTNISFRTTTTSAGAYTFALVQPGTYRLEAKKAGFKGVVEEQVVVQTGASAGRNIVLSVGEVQQSVEVQATAPLLNTTTADQGQVITQAQIQELPMQGRSPYALARLAPGVVPAGFLNDLKPYDVGGNSFVSISGSRRYSVEFALNGVPNSAPGALFSGFLAYTPPADSTQEFRVVTNGFDAQYGHNGAGVISVTTKSGTNAYHGSLYEYLQNDKLNGNSFFNNLNKARRPPVRYNQYGGGIGGPVMVPRIYNGKNKAFFFFSYEGIRNSAPGSQYATVPTEAMRGGDFSALLSRPQGAVQLYNPLSTTVDASGRVTRVPFANNQIPATLLNPIAKNMLTYVPRPNVGGAGQLENNYFTQVNRYDVYDNFLGRLDVNFSSKNRFFVSVGEYARTSVSGDLFHSVATGGGSDWPMWNAAIDDTHVVSPTFLLNGRLGFTRYTQDSLPRSFGFDPAQLGFPPAFTTQLSAPLFPAVSFGTGYNSFGASSPYLEHDYHYFATLVATWTKSAHTIRFAWEGREQQNNVWNTGSPGGAFSFNGQYASGPGLSVSPGFGSDFAQFLLGLPSGGSVDANSLYGIRGRYHALYSQDDWKVTPNLTLNLGFRYDMESPNLEKHNRQVTGWLRGANPIAQQAMANYAASPDAALPVSQFQVNGGMLYPGQNGSPNGWWDREWGRWQPRLGFAWNPGILARRVSVRGGFGISYYPSTPVAPFQPGYSATTPLVSTVDTGATFIASLSNPFPSGIAQPRGAADGPLTFLGLGAQVPQRHYMATRSNRWQFSVQVQATRSDVIELNYNGSTQNHIPGSVPLNFIPAQFLGRSATRDQAAIDFLNAPVKNPF